MNLQSSVFASSWSRSDSQLLWRNTVKLEWNHVFELTAVLVPVSLACGAWLVVRKTASVFSWWNTTHKKRFQCCTMEPTNSEKFRMKNNKLIIIISINFKSIIFYSAVWFKIRFAHVYILYDYIFIYNG